MRVIFRLYTSASLADTGMPCGAPETSQKEIHSSILLATISMSAEQRVDALNVSSKQLRQNRVGCQRCKRHAKDFSQTSVPSAASESKAETISTRLTVSSRSQLPRRPSNGFTFPGFVQVTTSVSLNELARKEKYLALEMNDYRFNVGVKYGLLNAQLALALTGKDRDEVITMLMELLLLRERNAGERNKE
jgi:hypothetical protein